jgi:hypothetical protein
MAELGKPLTTEKARLSLVIASEGTLDMPFFRRWRLDDGWLSPQAAERALEIFHDPLASALRRAVVERLYPETLIRNQ